MVQMPTINRPINIFHQLQLGFAPDCMGPFGNGWFLTPTTDKSVDMVWLFKEAQKDMARNLGHRRVESFVFSKRHSEMSNFTGLDVHNPEYFDAC